MRNEKDSFVGNFNPPMSLIAKSDYGDPARFGRVSSDCPEPALSAQDFLNLKHQSALEPARKPTIDEKIEYLKKELDFLRRSSRKIS
ncbi:hypothetical protein [uncultured Zhongshania sp.]|uniref:hypothetical protein n=1 Tax=uncultured Zhongshania sp. TaxID=1642288 RepID=UPI0025D47A13|nr:hypothetical protein [uncultured Zhongshania sp.]